MSCVGGVFACLPSPLRAWVGGSVWVWGLCVVVPRQSWLRGLGAVPRHSWLGSDGGGSFLCPLACSPPSSPWLRCLACCNPGVCSRTTRAVVSFGWGWVGGWGGLDDASGPIPWCVPFGGADVCTPREGVTLFYGPSICTRSVQMDLRRSQVLRRLPTPGSGTLWVAGESLRDRRVSCLPRWTVCPTRSPSLDTNRSTCRGKFSRSGPLVTL